jgi:sialate O-acetylesterase
MFAFSSLLFRRSLSCGFVPRFVQILAVIILSSGSIASGGELRLGSPFCDHMVLQREKPVAIWGRADAGEPISVSFGGQSKTVTAGAD